MTGHVTQQQMLAMLHRDQGVTRANARQMRLNPKKIAEEYGWNVSDLIEALGILSPREIEAGLSLMRTPTRTMAFTLDIRSNSMRRFKSGAQLVAPEFEEWFLRLVPRDVIAWWLGRPESMVGFEEWLQRNEIENLRFALTFAMAEQPTGDWTSYYRDRPGLVRYWESNWVAVLTDFPLPANWGAARDAEVIEA